MNIIPTAGTSFQRVPVESKTIPQFLDEGNSRGSRYDKKHSRPCEDTYCAEGNRDSPAGERVAKRDRTRGHLYSYENIISLRVLPLQDRYWVCIDTYA